MQHASQYACNGSATTGYNNSNVCNNCGKQESSGFLNLDTAHENHSDERDDSDSRHAAGDPERHLDVRRRALRARTRPVQSSMTSARLVSILY